MTQPDPGVTSPAEFDRLLAEIHLRMRQERYAEAAERIAKAKMLTSNNPIVLELEGDLLFATRRYGEAKHSYQQAFELEPGNPDLEEKYATCVVKLAEPSILALARNVPDDSPWSTRTRRPPWLSGLFSAILPGMGQWYNGDMLKAAVLIVMYVLFLLGQVLAAGQILKAWSQNGTQFDMGLFFAAVFQGSNILAILLLAAVWVYGIIDAILVAREAD